MGNKPRYSDCTILQPQPQRWLRRDMMFFFTMVELLKSLSLLEFTEQYGAKILTKAKPLQVGECWKQ